MPREDKDVADDVSGLFRGRGHKDHAAGKGNFSPRRKRDNLSDRRKHMEKQQVLEGSDLLIATGRIPK